MTPDSLPTQTGADTAGARIVQLTIAIGDRLGALHRALQALDPEPIRLCGISIVEGADHAFVRLVVDRPEVATRLLEEAGHPVFRRDLLAVALPRREERAVGIREVLHSLLAAEVRVLYAYSLAAQVAERSVLALEVEDMAVGERAIANAGLVLVDQDQLGWGHDED